MAAASFDSRFDFVPFSWPLPLPLGPAAVGGGATVPSPVRTPHAGPVGAGRPGGAWATRLARNAARSSFAAALGGSGATGAGMGTAAGGWDAGLGCRFFGIPMGGTEKVGGGRGGAGGGRAGSGGGLGWPSAGFTARAGEGCRCRIGPVDGGDRPLLVRWDIGSRRALEHRLAAAQEVQEPAFVDIEVAGEARVDPRGEHELAALEFPEEIKGLTRTADTAAGGVRQRPALKGVTPPPPGLSAPAHAR